MGDLMASQPIRQQGHVRDVASECPNLFECLAVDVLQAQTSHNMLGLHVQHTTSRIEKLHEGFLSR
jgi:hypothetical protein